MLEMKVEIKNEDVDSIGDILGLEEEATTDFIKEVVFSGTKGLVQSIIKVLESYEEGKRGAILVAMTAYQINEIMESYEEKLKSKK